jgi:hypothetical protein
MMSPGLRVTIAETSATSCSTPNTDRDTGMLPALPIDTWAAVVDQFEEGGFKQCDVGRLNGLRSLEESLGTKTLLHAVPAAE